MIRSMCQIGQATVPSFWSNTILGIAVKVFFDVINI